MTFAFLHGGGQGSWVWAETLAALGERAITLDIPGCGTKRGRDTTGLGIDAVAAELLQDIATAGLSDVILVGHSAAGTILPRMAERAPGLFRRLVFLTCTAPAPGLNVIEQMGGGLHGSSPDETGWPVDPATTTIEQRYEAMFCNDMDEAESRIFLVKLGDDIWPMATMTNRDWRYDHLVGVPSTYIVCERDQSLPPDWQHRFAARLQCDELVSIDAGHQAMNTQPEKLAAVLRAIAAAHPMVGGRA
ncbi:MAG: hypothetical protein RL367_997 [Pseudomonadota bacterium]